MSTSSAPRQAAPQAHAPKPVAAAPPAPVAAPPSAVASPMAQPQQPSMFQQMVRKLNFNLLKWLIAKIWCNHSHV